MTTKDNLVGKRVLLAWELGGGTGRASALARAGDLLAMHGAEISWAVKESGRVVLVADDLAPARPSGEAAKAPAVALPVSYADLLQTNGYCCEQTLAALVGEWMRVLERVAPALVVMDHAPTAALAAGVLGITAVRVGNGFACPPLARDMPALQPWRVGLDPAVRALERKVLARINDVLAGFGAAPTATLGRAVAGDQSILCSLPELDAYQRPPEAFAGVLEPGAPVAPPSRRSIFAALTLRHPALDRILQAIRQTGLAAVVAVEGIGDVDAEERSGGDVRVVSCVPDVAGAIASATLAVSDGSHAVLAQAIRCGRPTVVFPTDLEQWLHGRAVARAGLGAVFEARDAGGRGLPFDPLTMTRAVLADDGMAYAAARTAQHLAASMPDPRRRILESCRAAMDGGGVRVPVASAPRQAGARRTSIRAKNGQIAYYAPVS